MSCITFLKSIGIVGDNGYFLLSEALEILEFVSQKLGLTVKRFLFYFTFYFDFYFLYFHSF